MRTSSVLLALFVAACGAPGGPANTSAPAEATAAAADRISCARGRAPLARTCTVEQTTDGNGLVLTLRHPDGGFRRLRVTRDGRGVVAADGAEKAAVVVVDAGAIDVRVGDDRYRLPATVKPGAR